MLRVLVADDESLARETVKLILSDIPYVTDVFEACNGTEALKVAQESQPDIVILDVEMPGCSGLELAKQLPDKCIVVFATAYNDYAIEAFELNAVDYILKPFEDDRFVRAIEKAAGRHSEKGFKSYHQLHSSLHSLAAQENDSYRERLIVRDPGRIRLIDVENISFISGAGNYAEVHLQDGKVILHRETLCELEKQLNPNLFVRIHRSSIVQRKMVVELRPNDKGDYTVILVNGETLTLSRRNRNKLEEIMH
ncbi:response regulator transcription factor [Glaciecola sp. MH2013]|uniref:LytR/AlgR family response regulator transcription factor n=1 Tax=Glaciecola sp. MH2013 TaxID=2785524 RepID=UPI00189E512C|nr:LytTR family DNA-binding domain-containing protein [Glaciecola sp. MH2013]MBF7074512.1 response regulator transcription factor [Glaciecola sp. MH2013]